MRFDNPLKLENCSLHLAECGCASLPSDIPLKLYKLLVVNSGEYRLELDGRDYVLTCGNAVLLFPYETYKLTGDGVSSSCSYVCFTLETVRYGDLLCGGKGPDRIFDDKNLMVTVSNICCELSSQTAAYSTELVSLLSSQMLVYLSRRIGESASDDSVKDSNFRICSQVMSFIDNRIYTMKNLREVAAEMGYNYSYISTLFRKTTGTTLNAYFKTRRMEEAKRLLQDKRMSVSEIARVMNYSSVYAFSKAFKEYFGTSPGHYSGRFPKKED